MKKALFSVALVAVGVFVMPAFVRAQDNSLAAECAALLSVPDDNSSVSSVFSFETQDNSAIVYKTVPQLTPASGAVSGVCDSGNTKIQNRAVIYLREEPHFRYSVKLE